MAKSLKLFFVALFLCFIVRGNSQSCGLSAITVGVSNTGQKSPDPVFEVEVKNTCRCPAAYVLLRSLGFTSRTLVDPKLFRRAGSDYLVNDGKAIPSMQSVKFRYSWDRAFQMSVSGAQFDSC